MSAPPTESLCSRFWNSFCCMDWSQPVEGVGFLVDGVPQEVKTDATGHALLMHLPANRDVDLALNINDLEDPSLQPVRKGLRFVPRPGLPLQAVFPVVAFGEVAGTLRTRGPAGAKVLAGVTPHQVLAALALPRPATAQGST